MAARMSFLSAPADSRACSRAGCRSWRTAPAWGAVGVVSGGQVDARRPGRPCRHRRDGPV